MDEKQILYHINQLLTEISQSSRWNNPDNPIHENIADIGKRVNSSESLNEFRKKEDYSLLLEISSQYEECFNDDWLPSEIFGLELKSAKKFINEILRNYNEIPNGQWTMTIKEIYNRMK